MSQPPDGLRTTIKIELQKFVQTNIKKLQLQPLFIQELDFIGERMRIACVHYQRYKEVEKYSQKRISSLLYCMSKLTDFDLAYLKAGVHVETSLTKEPYWKQFSLLEEALNHHSTVKLGYGAEIIIVVELWKIFSAYRLPVTSTTNGLFHQCLDICYRICVKKQSDNGSRSWLEKYLVSRDGKPSILQTRTEKSLKNGQKSWVIDE